MAAADDSVARAVIALRVKYQPAEVDLAAAPILDAWWFYHPFGDALKGVESATMVQVTEGGERLVTDGPFAETREVLGGYYLLDVPDLDAAIEWAARCPGAWHGSRIEVRPIMEFEQP